ncbi:putative phage baseplate assembly protein [Actinomycetospora cinnamomea]|uniref:Putative phage baseplate assembly protein n=2 Tax=Actinomycetospora cinnamomea TaxID=663609 RepID=A0A2U1F7Q5_9PSEU|nr:putative phage baseplate assembly protein [Actinomycetospora cinnamomea]
MDAGLWCDEPRRRRVVRDAGFGGIDAVEISADHRTLTVTLIGAAPGPLAPGNVELIGEPALRVLDARLERAPDDERDDGDGGYADDRLIVRLDRAGGPQPYTLALVDADVRDRPAPGFDPRFARVELSFLAGCPADVDCAATPQCPDPEVPEPALSYLAKDYASFRRLVLDRMALLVPGWTERHAPDLEITLVEILAYVGDHLSYLQDAIATEAYLDTARRRISVRRHLRLVDHRVHEGTNARAWVCVAVDARLDVPAGELVLGTAAGEIFAPVVPGPRTFHPENGEIAIWTWGDAGCCLPAGATSLTLAGEPVLTVGDVLVLEEVRDPGTGLAADADPAHRQAVRLTAVTPGRDALYDQPVVDVRWAVEDALGFAVCTEVTVARGNVVLVDHGTAMLSSPWEIPVSGRDRSVPTDVVDVTWRAPYPPHPAVAAAQADHLEAIPGRALERVRALAGVGRLLDEAERAELVTLAGRRGARRVRGLAGLAGLDAAAQALVVAALADEADVLLHDRFAWLARRAARARAGAVLDHGEVDAVAEAFGAAYAAGLAATSPSLAGPAAEALRQDPGAALPELELRESDGARWVPRGDLLGSEPDDRHVVPEVDDDDRLHLRFGDDRLGRAPEPGAPVTVRWRRGNGTAGNVGAGAIDRVRGTFPAITAVRNPLPAQGGTDPEPMALARRLGPHTLRATRERAVIPADYAELAAAVPGVDRAAAQRRWTGSTVVIDVAIDPVGVPVAPPELLRRVDARLHRYRRIGHDVVVRSARTVSLHLALRVCARPERLRAHVEVALRAALRALFAPDRASFGDPVVLSTVVAAAAAVPGVESVVVTRLERLHEGDRGERAEGLLRLGPFEVARLDADPARPDHGILDLVVDGAR